MVEDATIIFQQLLQLPHETEWVEFNEARQNFDFNDMGRYFSALSNAADLNGQPAGWLVFGVSDTVPREIVGTGYRAQPPGLEKLRQQIAQHTNHQMTFRRIHELRIEDKRVLLFEIPPASRGVPTTWDGIAYGRIHDALSPLPLDRTEQIRRQVTYEDWSAQVCPKASFEDLDAQAVDFARQQYTRKNPHLLSLDR